MKYGLTQNAPLARFTSWKIGGAAKQLFIPSSISDFANFLKQTPTDEPLYILGLGSNTLIRDGGIPGTVIVLSSSGLQSLSVLDDVTIRAEAGVSCAKMARFAARNDLSGMTFLAGVPGTIGGALAMNAGAHGDETWNHVVSVETIDRDGNLHARRTDEFNVAYRCVKGNTDEYFVAANFVHEKSTKEQALASIKHVLDHRVATQPGNMPNGGSVFRNPNGDYAGRLIEMCGLKGYKYGHTWISDLHANFIVHDGKGCAKEVEHLIHLIEETILSKMGITLEREVKVIGCGSNDNN